MKGQDSTCNSNVDSFDSTSKEDIIADYVAAGFTLINVAGKVPTNKNWQQTEYNMFATAQDFPGNYGVKLNAETLVIDYDPRNDKTEGRRAIKNLQEYLGGIAFDTYTVVTGGNGLHIYLKKPPEIAVVNTLYKERKNRKGEVISIEYPEFSGIEFKSLGRQVIGPTSIHPETKKPYKIAYRRPSYIMQAPDKLIELIKKSGIAGIDTTKTAMDHYDDSEQAVQRFKYFLSTHPPAIEGDGGDTHTYKTACRGRDFGLSPQKVFELMWTFWNPKCCPPWDENGMWTKVKSAFENNSDIQGKWNPQTDFKPVQKKEVIANHFDRAANGSIKKTLHNICLLFSLPTSPLKDLLCYNAFTENIEFRDVPPWRSEVDNRTGWSDEDAIQMKYWLSSTKMIEVSTNLVHEAALKVAMDNVIHPVLEYLENLEWDGIQRIKYWLRDYAGVEDNDYTRAISEKVLLAAVTRIYKPGTKFDYVLVLEGAQGIGKSTIAHTLGGKWFGDITLDPHDRDTIDALRGKWIVELSEMECTRREVNALKRFISCTSDTARLAYARTAKEFPRKSIFIGTVNPEAGRGYLKDSTGNRRFWPVEVTKADFDGLRRDVDQLWAEAVATYKKGNVKLYLEDVNVSRTANAEANKRYEADPWEDVILDYLTKTEKEYTTLMDIVDNCLLIPHSKLEKSHRVRIHTVMQRLGWTNGIKRVDGKVLRCFAKNKESINRNL
jgi:predicted P-loop ATPase